MRARVGIASLLTFVFAASLAAVAVAKPSAPSGAGHTFTANGVTIWYEMRGGPSGVPFVVVNGGPGFEHSYELCSDAWDNLAKKRPIVFYDQRGTGRSSAFTPKMSCTLQDQIADLEALRIELHAPKLDLLGHSWGGYLVMAYATRHPENISHLMICDSAAPKWGDTEFLFKNFYPGELDEQARVDLADQLGDPTAFGRSLDMYLGWLFVSPAKRDEFMAHKDEYKMSRATNEALNADLAKYDFWPALRAFTFPTLVMTGRHDINVAPSTAYKIHQAIPNSRFVVFEVSGHMPFFEESEAFVHAVEDFLGAPVNLADPQLSRPRAR